jgi:hypothetical protein
LAFAALVCRGLRCEVMGKQKITFGEMGVRGPLVYCSDYHSSHSLAMSGWQITDLWKIAYRARLVGQE